MKIKRSNLKIYRLQVANSPRRFIVDQKLAQYLVVFSWKYVPRIKQARATTDPKAGREFLHRFIVRELLKKKWIEVYFENGDTFDCRIQNLRPYRRDIEGAKRAVFKNKRVPMKGVFLRSGKSKVNPYGANIRVNKKLRHLGYFPTARLAAQAHTKAWNLAHPK